MTSSTHNIGEVVEVFCDHKRGGRRIRDWVEGVVVHADDRMTAVQFRNDVYLTDGWMVPDRILWFNRGTEKIRSAKKNRGGLKTGRQSTRKRTPARPASRATIKKRKKKQPPKNLAVKSPRGKNHGKRLGKAVRARRK